MVCKDTSFSAYMYYKATENSILLLVLKYNSGCANECTPAAWMFV